MTAYPKRKKKGQPEDKIAAQLQVLELFDEWRAQVLPELQQMLLKGVPAEEILKRYAPHLAARIITVALTDADGAKALTAAKDGLDRVQGKAVERKKIQHEMAALSDEQLDALLLTEMGELETSSDEEDSEAEETVQ